MVLNQYTSLTWLLDFSLRAYQYVSYVSTAVETERIAAQFFSLLRVPTAIVVVSFVS